MHWARVIRESDNPEWTAVLHADGSLSEVKVSIANDQLLVKIDAAAGKEVRVNDGTA